MLCGFIFDIVIVRVEVPNIQFEEPSALAVDVTFRSHELQITSSRINVVEFRPGFSQEFESTPQDLRAELENCPLQLCVKYKNEHIGTGYMVWPMTVLDKINAGFGELTHVDECDLINDDKIGTVEVILRLQEKCQELGENQFPRTGDEIRQHLDKVINPHDILFVVGDAKKPDDCAELLDPHESSDCDKNATALDLSPYRLMNGKLIQTPDVLNTCMNTDCCELKKISNQYQKLIDTLVSGCGRNEPRTCRASSHNHDCPHENKFSTSSTAGSSECKFPCQCFAAQHSNDGAFSGEKLMNICPQGSPPNEGQMVHITPKRCPICKEDKSYLPKLAACPKCGYKPLPFVEEKPYNDKLTADQILQEYLEKRSSGTEPQSTVDPEPQRECRCTCKNGKICAHCRIRKLCEDIFQTNSQNGINQPKEECGKCEQVETELYNVCKSSSKDCRPYLARVFSELKDLYDIKKSQRKTLTKNKRCERELQLGKDKKNKKGKGANISQVRAPDDTQSAPEESKAPKSKRRKKKELDRTPFLIKNRFKKKPKQNQYDYSSLKALVESNTGHKTCINGFAGRKNVPRNMGWLWNLNNNVRRGWKPGAIRKPIKEMMKYFLKDYPADTIRVSQYSYRNQAKGDCNEDEELVQKPTLHICKKNEAYFITLRPLKDPEALKQCADPYMNMKPIQFKITKNPVLCALRTLKRDLKDMGFCKCTCHHPVSECCCRNYLDKKRLEYQINKECRKRNLPCCSDNIVLTDTSESDTEFDFGVTPPAGVIKPERLHKPNLVNHGTQYSEGDWNVPRIFAKPPNKFMKLYNCAIGDRYGPPGFIPGRSTGGMNGMGAMGWMGMPGMPGMMGPGAKGAKGKGGGPGGKMGGKFGPCGAAGAGAGPGGTGRPNGGKVDMMKYMKANKGAAGSAAAEQRKKKLRVLGEIPPPLLCMVDRRGKPDPCGPCGPCETVCCDDVCTRRRIC